MKQFIKETTAVEWAVVALCVAMIASGALL